MCDYIYIRVLNNVPLPFTTSSSTNPLCHVLKKVLAQYTWIFHRRINTENNQTWENNFSPMLSHSEKRTALLPGTQLSPTWPKSSSPLMKVNWLRSIGGKILAGKNGNTWGKTYSRATLCTKNTTRSGPGIEAGLPSETVATNHLHHEQSNVIHIQFLPHRYHSVFQLQRRTGDCFVGK